MKELSGILDEEDDMSPSISQIKKMAVPVMKRAGVKRSAIFGSVARGEQKKTSDIDLLVEFRPGKSLLDLVYLRDELNEVLGRRVDIVTYSSLAPSIRDHILEEQIEIL